jgi:hypothetical protein
MSLVDDITRLAKTLSPSEIPSSVDTQHVVGAIIKVLDSEGVKVADELFPAVADAVAPEVAAAAAVAPEAVTALADLIKRAEDAVRQLEGKTPEPPAPTGTVPPEPATPPASEPVAPPIDGAS